MDLAIFGGAPRFSVPQHVGGPIVEPETRERFHRLADGAFARNYLTNAGPLTEALEAAVAERHQMVDSVFMANATLAQLVLMKAMGLESGEAIVAANTFIATAHVCRWLGMKPVFCDLDPATLNLDPADLAAKITPATRAVAPTHVFGCFADMPAIIDTARRHGVAVLADAAHCFDCRRGEVYAGGFGVPEFLSFHATKFFSTLEGGAVLTEDPDLARELRELRNFGFDQPGGAGKLGINAKASEISAAFGLASLPALEERRQRLLTVRNVYLRTLSGLPGLRIHPVDALGKNNYRYFAVFIDAAAYGLERDAVAEALRRENILVRLYFHPGCHRMPYYADGAGAVSLPATDKALAEILCLPTSFVEAEAEAAAEAVAAVLTTLHERREAAARWWKTVRP